MKGFFNRVLRIDLTEQTFRYDDIPDAVLSGTLGGKGLEPAGFDPRVLKGMGLSYATASRGACHLRGTFYKAELSGEMAKDQIAGKAELLVDYEDREEYNLIREA